jgi:hypothetical protein
MPDDLFKEEIFSILTNYGLSNYGINVMIEQNDEKYIAYENEIFEKSRELYLKNQKLRIELFKSGLKNRFIEYFKINKK